MVVMAEENGNVSQRHCAYIHLNESMSAADVNYFYQSSHLGNKMLSEWRLKCTNSSIKDPKQQFIKYLSEDCGTLVETSDTDPPFLQIPNWVRNRMADSSRKINFSALQDPSNYLTDTALATDFTTKMIEKEVTSLQDYYVKGQ